MKNFLKSLGLGYFLIGSLLSIPMALSYVYAQWFVLIGMGWSVFSFSGLSFLMIFSFPKISISTDKIIFKQKPVQ